MFRLSIDNLVEKLRERVGEFERKPMHWIVRGDRCRTLCLDCAKKVAKKGDFIDGGFRCEEDHQRACDICQCMLDHDWTDHGVEYEICASADEIDGPISQSEAATLLDIIDCGVPRLTESCGDFRYRPDLIGKLEKIWFRLNLAT